MYELDPDFLAKTVTLKWYASVNATHVDTQYMREDFAYLCTQHS